jgi:hypothetical protein
MEAMCASEANSDLAQEATASQYAWEQIRQIRFQVADEIDRMASELEAGTVSWVSPVSGWLRSSADYQEAMAQPMVLAICLPLSKKLMDRNREMMDLLRTEPNLLEEGSAPKKSTTPVELFSASEIQQAVRWGFRQVIGREKSVSWRIFVLLLYPVLTTMVAWALWVAACFIFFLPLQESFEEFGIELPKATVFLFWSAAIVREWWGVMLLIPLVYAALFIGLNYLRSNRSGNRGSWLDRKLIGKRSAVARWSWHLSLLLDWGLATKTAVMVAGMCSQRGWLQQRSLDWIGEAFNPATISQSQNATGGLATRDFFSQKRFQLVNHALALPDGKAKILLLREISTLYQENSSSFTEWMIAWLSTLLVWVSFGMVLMILFSIYSPLFQMFSVF